MLTGKWGQILGALDHGFQPIVNSHSAVAYGYEALLRNVEAAGFYQIGSLFDAAYRDGVLVEFEAALRRKAVEKFCRLPFAERVKLFLNVDNRIFETSSGSIDRTVEAATRLGLLPSALCIELSERQGGGETLKFRREAGSDRKQQVRIAVDDFGQGSSGLRRLYDCEPDIIKIDRFFIDGIADDQRRRLFVAKIVGLAKSLGSLVVAEGVERADDLKVCRDIGCDLVQGYFIARPTTDLSDLRLSYEAVVERTARPARPGSLVDRVSRELVNLRTIQETATIPDAIALFAEMEGEGVLPVVDAAGEPVGLIREQDIKPFIYNPYGRDLLANKATDRSVLRITSRCPVVDITAPVDEFVNNYVSVQGQEGVIVVEERKYLGFLSSRALIGIVAERNVAVARDQNPLTGLPGNGAILEFLRDALADETNAYVFVYFDFDNFKPFNDAYGFAQGDRVILLFANLLKRFVRGESTLIAHLGGDDFVAGFVDAKPAEVEARILPLLDQFRNDVESFYDAADRKRGGLTAQDRDGAERLFPLMRVSAVMLSLPLGRPTLTEDQVVQAIALGKKRAKRDARGLAEITPSNLDVVRLQQRLQALV